MFGNTPHHLHIPVMGTAFTIDTPIKVARFGITSVMSIGDDELCEYTRAYYLRQRQEPYDPITKQDDDYRAKRITAYLNLVDCIVKEQMTVMRQLSFDGDNDLVTYFDLLPHESELKKQYLHTLSLPECDDKKQRQDALKHSIKPGSIDVNIMTKIDRNTYDKNAQPLPDMYSDALSALRGYANSTLVSSIEFSAGFNRRLYAYIDQFNDFFPDKDGHVKKKIIIKVSDMRSSLIQGKFLAKKGLWIAEHRIESGLNCGGHVFPTDGELMGPILEAFKDKKQEMFLAFYHLVNHALSEQGRPCYQDMPHTRVTVQGGVGTANEHRFLREHYGVDAVGWGTPFLLVPEATNVDPKTRTLLATSPRENFYTSGISPLGVRFNTVKQTESEGLRHQRIAEGKAGSPCPKGFLVNNTEFTKKPICTASKQYQRRKIEQLQGASLSEDVLQKSLQDVLEKTCLCEDLAASALINHHQSNNRPLAPAICPGPNMGYFDRIFVLKEMVAHIYGEVQLMTHPNRPNFFISELKMYIENLSYEIKKSLPKPTDKQKAYFRLFRHNLSEGIDYYKHLIPKLTLESQRYKDAMINDLLQMREELGGLVNEYTTVFIDPQASPL